MPKVTCNVLQQITIALLIVLLVTQVSIINQAYAMQALLIIVQELIPQAPHIAHLVTQATI